MPAPSRGSIAKVLATFCEKLSPQPATLHLVGRPHTPPRAIATDGHGIDTDLVSDLLLTQIDADPFAESAYARFCAQNLQSAAHTAYRGFVEPPRRADSRTFATTEWEDVARDELTAAEWTLLDHHTGNTRRGTAEQESFRQETVSGCDPRGSGPRWTTSFTMRLRSTTGTCGCAARTPIRTGRLRFDGHVVIDEHDDGSRTLHWRVRLVDFDMERGEIREQRSQARFRMVQR